MSPLSTILFYLLALGAAVSAVLVVTRRQPVASAVALVAVMLCLAGLYGLLAAPFLALLQVLIYAGAIMVLVVFVIMLLKLDDKELAEDRLGAGSLLLTLVPVGLLALLAGAAIVAGGPRTFPRAAEALGGIRDLGRLLFTTWIYPFEAVSLLLLVAIVGAVILAQRKKP